MTTRYEQGRSGEYRCQTELEAAGYTTCRAAGSKGKIDVIAWNTNEIRFIQVKTHRNKTASYKADLAALALLPAPTNATIELWSRKVGSRTWDVTFVQEHPDAT